MIATIESRSVRCAGDADGSAAEGSPLLILPPGEGPVRVRLSGPEDVRTPEVGVREGEGLISRTQSQAGRLGSGRHEFDLDAKYRVEDGSVLLTGVQALVRLIFDQIRADRRRGLNTAAFVSGYPGSPLGGFDLALSRAGQYRELYGVTHVPGLNEELAATAVWGSQQDHLAPLRDCDGVIGFWYGKAPGVDRSGDVFRHANQHGAGRNGGVVCAVGDDPSSKSSTFPSHSEFALADAMMPVLVPGSVQEVLDLGRHGFEISRLSGCWTALKMVSAVADGFGTALVSPDRLSTVRPSLSFEDGPWSHHQARRLFVPETLEIERELAYRRHEAVRDYAWRNNVNELVVDPSVASCVLVASGRTYHELRGVLSRAGIGDVELGDAGVRLLRVGMIYPLERRIVERAVRGVEEVFVLEEKRGLIEPALREMLYHRPDRPRLVGKCDEGARPLVPADGELTAERLLPILAGRLSGAFPDLLERGGRQAVRVSLGRGSRGSAGHRDLRRVVAPELGDAARTAHFCSGCPHNRSTVEVSGSPVGAGVGCHALVLWMDRGVTSYTQMGGEGAQWIGRAPFTDTGHLVQNMGDGTFFHSGSLVVRAAVAAGVHMTFKILYNGVVAMTGGQDPVGRLSVPRLVSLLQIEGVGRIIVCADEPEKYRRRRQHLPRGVELWGRERLGEAERDLAVAPGVTALVYDQACAAELRRLRKRDRLPARRMRVLINERVCEGCGDCGAKSSCLSVQPVVTEFGRKTKIHQSSCNTDYSCLDGDCPAFVTVTAPKDKVLGRNVDISAPVPQPDERPLVGPGGYGVFLAGIGGTGVVTVNQVLATAALLDGFEVSGLDQTGLSQKGGPVVSHLRLFSGEADGSTELAAGQADCVLALDLIVAVESKNLLRADRDRTRTVASTSRTPTARMVMDPDVDFPDVAPLVGALQSVSRPGLVAIDAGDIAGRLFSDHMAANMVMLGAAYQAGVLPVTAASLERAVRLNGVAIEQNLNALTAGRLAVADPGGLARLLEAGPDGAGRSRAAGRAAATAGQLLAGTRIDGDAARFAKRGVEELVAFQGAPLARRYLAVLEAAAAADRRVLGAEGEFCESVARHLFKLFAYKDEYEVARLHRVAIREGHARSEVPGSSRHRILIHPPVLRELGMKSKIALPSAIAGPLFAVLVGMRRVRGTPFDPFGRTEVRRAERRLAREFEASILELASVLDRTNYALAVELARLPDLVRGYEGIKLANIARYDERRADLLGALRSAGTQRAMSSREGG